MELLRPMSAGQKPEISVFVTNRFEKSLNKLKTNQLSIVEDEIDKIISDPSIGIQKKGDLKHLWVHKFKLGNHEWLLGYNWNSKRLTIHLLQLGSHENYYENAKKKRKTDFKILK